MLQIFIQFVDIITLACITGALIKMNVLPRLLYPLQIIHIYYPTRLLRCSKAGWAPSPGAKRSPFSRWQNFKWQVVMEVRCTKSFYQLASHLWLIASWHKCDPASIWHDIESSQSEFPLLNLLFMEYPESVKNLCTDPNTLSTIRAWSSIRRPGSVIISSHSHSW